jgi:hypothetical protein
MLASLRLYKILDILRRDIRRFRVYKLVDVSEMEIQHKPLSEALAVCMFSLMVG